MSDRDSEVLDGDDGEGLIDRLRGWIDVQAHIDEEMYRLAEQVVATEAGALFLLAKPFTAEDMGQVLGAFIS